MKQIDAVQITARINREDISYVCGILESYDDFGVIRTIDTDQYIVEFLVSPFFLTEMNFLLDALKKEIGLTVIEPLKKKTTLT